LARNGDCCGVVTDPPPHPERPIAAIKSSDRNKFIFNFESVCLDEPIKLYMERTLFTIKFRTLKAMFKLLILFNAYRASAINFIKLNEVIFKINQTFFAILQT